MDRDTLVDRLQQRGILETPRIIDAFRHVDRERFVPPEHRRNAYTDTALPIGGGQTISAPHMVAVMTERLDPQETDTVLEIGAGSGYQAAILAQLVDHVYTVEVVADLAEQARDRLADYDTVTVIHGDGSTGLPEHAPFDKILYTAAAPRIPDDVLDQLAPGGRLIAPIGGRDEVQTVHIYDKDDDGTITVETDAKVRFVPLTGEEGVDE